MASAVIGIQLVTRVAVGSGTTRKESSSELSVTLKIHLEGRKDNRSFGVHGFQTRFLFPHRNVAGGGGGRGREIRGAICHPPIVLPFEYEPYSYQSTNFVILGRFYFPPRAVAMPLDDSSPTHISPRVHSCGNFDIPRIWREMSDLDRISPQPLDPVRFPIATLVLFRVSSFTPLLHASRVNTRPTDHASHPFRAPLI